MWRLMLILIVSGCHSAADTPNGAPMTLDSAAGQLAKLSGKPIRPFATFDFGREKNGSARSVVVAKEQGERIVHEMRKTLGPGLLVFVGCTRSLAVTAEEGSEIVLAEGESQFDILRIAKSDAVNFDMETEDLIHKLKEYDSRYGIDIYHAETDTIEFAFRTLPSDMKAFCEDLYRFCPDIVDQGVGSVAELEKGITQFKTVYLWWD